ncbi:MAG: hypothetical protein ACRDPY_36190, partial [Streptosporangiaceae bacterium]
QPVALDVDAGVDEGGGDPFGEVLEHVGGLGARAGGEADVVDLIDFTDRPAASTRPDLRLLIDYMSATESAGMLPHSLPRVAGVLCRQAEVLVFLAGPGASGLLTGGCGSLAAECAQVIGLPLAGGGAASAGWVQAVGLRAWVSLRI